LAKPERGLATVFRPSEAVRGGGHLLHINSYTAFIDNFMRNVSEGKSDDLRQGMVHSGSHLTDLLFGTIRNKRDMEKAMGLSLIVPPPIIHKSRVSKSDERATRPMLRMALHLAVLIRIGATWSPLDAMTVTNSWLTVVFPSECGEKDTSSRQPQLNGQRGAEVSSPTEACIIFMLCARSIRTGPVVLHRSMMCVFAQSPQSQKNLLGKDFTGNPSPSVSS
jgi:hypothetical protein